MFGVNKCMFIGSVAEDPFIGMTKDNRHYAKLRLLILEKNPSSKSNEPITVRIEVTCFGPEAEKVKNYVRQNSRIFVEARYSEHTYMCPKDNIEKKSRSFVNGRVTFIEKKDDPIQNVQEYAPF